MLSDMGLMLIIGMGIVFGLGVLAIVGHIAINYSYDAYRRYRQAKQIILYNGILRYVLQSNLKLGVAACISLKLMVSTGSAVISAIILIGICASPIVFRVILIMNQSKLSLYTMKQTIGSIYLDLNTDNRWGLLYSQVFMLRRIHFLILTFVLTEYPNLQIHFFCYTTVWYIIFLMQTMPHKTRLTTYSEFINETLLILISYHFILFADLISDADTVKQVG